MYQKRQERHKTPKDTLTHRRKDNRSHPMVGEGQLFNEHCFAKTLCKNITNQNHVNYICLCNPEGAQSTS